MSELQNQPLQTNSGNAKVVYFLYLASLVFGITSFIGVVMAYINRQDAEPWLQTHYQFQIRTFWLGILYSFVAYILVFVLIGYVLFLVILVWMIVRCVVGIKALDKQQAIIDPDRWGL